MRVLSKLKGDLKGNGPVHQRGISSFSLVMRENFCCIRLPVYTSVKQTNN